MQSYASSGQPSQKRAYIILIPLIPNFYLIKLGIYRGIHYFSYYCSKQRLWVNVRTASSRRSNEYPQSMFWAEIWKNVRIFVSEIFHFLVVKFSVYLNRHVFVMEDWSDHADAQADFIALEAHIKRFVFSHCRAQMPSPFYPMSWNTSNSVVILFL